MGLNIKMSAIVFFLKRVDFERRRKIFGLVGFLLAGVIIGDCVCGGSPSIARQICGKLIKV